MNNKQENGGVSIKNAVIINAAGKYSSVIFQIIFTAVLSRILSPAEFGVITVINVFVVFFELFSDLGIGTAVIQNKELDDTDIKSIFSFTIVLGVALALLFSAFSFVIAWIYDNSVYVPLGMLFSITIFCTSLNVVPNALLMKNKKFIIVSIRTVVSCVAGYAVAIVLAYLGFSYYALVIRSIVSTLILLIWNLSFSRKSLGLTRNLSSVKKIWNYSAFQFGSSFLNYFQRNLDNMLVGKFMGEESLGYYNKSYTLMQYPVTYLSQVITPVLHPILSDFQDRRDIIFKQYLKVVQLLSMLGVLIAGVFICCSDEIIRILYGSQWKLAVEPLRIISFCIWPQMISGTVGCVMQSLGDTKGLFKMCLCTICVSVLGISLGVYSGTLVGLARCVVVIYWIHFAIAVYTLIRRGMGIALKSKDAAIWIDFIMLIIMYAVSSLTYKLIAIDGMLLSFIVKCCIICGVFLLMIIVTKKNKILLDLIKK